MAKWGEGDPRWIVEERVDGTNVNNWHWTEKNAFQWSKARIGELLTGLEVSGPEGSAQLTEVANISGEASARYVPAFGRRTCVAVPPTSFPHEIKQHTFHHWLPSASPPLLTSMRCCCRCHCSNRKGKVIIFYEIEVKLKWKGTTADGTAVTGTMSIPNLSEENDIDEIEITVAMTSDSTPERNKVARVGVT